MASYWSYFLFCIGSDASFKYPPVWVSSSRPASVEVEPPGDASEWFIDIFLFKFFPFYWGYSILFHLPQHVNSAQKYFFKSNSPISQKSKKIFLPAEIKKRLASC
jgi:hypothetical protein